MSHADLFSDPAACDTLGNMSAADRDALAFGVVEVSEAGVVRAYSRWESNFSGLAPASVIGRNFFTDVASCTNNYMFAERFLEGGAGMDETFDYVFTFKMKPIKVVIRLLKSQETAFVLVRKRRD